MGFNYRDAGLFDGFKTKTFWVCILDYRAIKRREILDSDPSPKKNNRGKAGMYFAGWRYHQAVIWRGSRI